MFSGGSVSKVETAKGDVKSDTKMSSKATELKCFTSRNCTFEERRVSSKTRRMASSRINFLEIADTNFCHV